MMSYDPVLGRYVRRSYKNPFHSKGNPEIEITYGLAGFLAGLFTGLIVYHGILYSAVGKFKELGLLRVPYSHE